MGNLLRSREDRVRRVLRHAGLNLQKTPARSWMRAHYGVGYQVFDDANTVVYGCYYRRFQATLEECEVYAADLATV